MLDKNYLEKIAIKEQTVYVNVCREYIQSLFLRSFYTKTGSENFLFKGGTALRIAFKSPRFSEDLDFTGLSDGRDYEEVLEGVIYDLTSEGFEVDIEESKGTSGGYLANISVGLHGDQIQIKNQISFREKKSKIGENVIIVSDLVPTFNLFILDRKTLLSEKITALMDRAKPRDFFDLHYILSNQNLRKEVKIDSTDREKILMRIKSQDKNLLENELKIFLPKSFWGIIKDLPAVLKGDLV